MPGSEEAQRRATSGSLFPQNLDMLVLGAVFGRWAKMTVTTLEDAAASE